ncbi:MULTISPECIES: L,D-transpeptidase family protein [unclassified Nocardia]|uniref:L,D-transpeptidase n=1 Tax=unclassified Nocardia TaxID=2637762 RepID=UPI001CE47063|nr:MULTISPECIES: L,D-transpeptidase [unclassified Nocardia]
MRSALRHLFLATAIVVFGVFGSGAATAAMIDAPPGPSVVGIAPSAGQTVGIAAPVTVTFAAAVQDRARAEHAFTISAPKPVTGTFSWIDDRDLRWNPTGFLPADARINVGIGPVHTQFQTNGGVSGEGDMSAHTFSILIGGQVVRTMPASYGKPGWETPPGTWPVLEKARSVVFDSRTIGIPLSSPQGYIINGEFAERLTWGGVYIHSAPWSVEQQGNSNVSHGCVNLAPGDAEWVYNTINVGDPVNLHW